MKKTKRSAADDFTLETIYAFAHCETWLEDYSKSHGLPVYELTERVAELLRSQTGGTLLGVIDRMPKKPGPSTSERSEAVATVAVASGSRGELQGMKKRRFSAKARKNMRAAQRKRWALLRGGKAA